MVSHCALNKFEQRARMQYPVRTCQAWLRTVFCLPCLLTICLSSSELLANEPSLPQPSQQVRENFTQRPETVYGTKASYRVYRNKKPVGVHTLRFSHQPRELTVEVESRLAVKVLGITFYRYEYSAVEIWSGGELVRISSEIRNNKKSKVDIVASSQGSYWLIDGKGKSRSTSSPEWASLSPLAWKGVSYTSKIVWMGAHS